MVPPLPPKKTNGRYFKSCKMCANEVTITMLNMIKNCKHNYLKFVRTYWTCKILIVGIFINSYLLFLICILSIFYKII